MNEAKDIQALRARLEGTRGREYWRSLEALSDTPEFRGFLHREFPQNASEWLDPVGRRGFLKLMGASLALAAVSACTRQPVATIVPYVRQPEEIVPGKPLFYATAMPFAGSGVGLLIESHEGRPTKIEGNPDHPSSGGATDVFAQAAIYDLYDPDRGTTPTKGTRQSGGGWGNHSPAQYSEFDSAFTDLLRTSQADGGSRLRILAEPTTSPTFLRLQAAILAKLPQAKFHVWSPVHDGNAREGAKIAFNQAVNVV